MEGSGVSVEPRSHAGVRLVGPEGLEVLSVGVRMAAARPHRFRADLCANEIGAMRVHRLRTSAVSASRTPASVDDEHGGHLAVLVVGSGEATVEQQHARWRLRAGEMGVVDFGEAFEIALAGRGDYLSVHLPHAVLAARSVDTSALAGVVVPAGPLARTLLGAIGEFAESDLGSGDRLEAALVEHAVVDLAVAAIRTASGGSAEGSASATGNRSRAIEFVESNFTDPTLTVARVAAALNVSPRYLHKLFEGEEHSVYELIRRRRVARGLDLLTDPAHAHLSIGQVATRSGFVGSSQFGRAVRQISGSTPRAIRGRGVDQDSSGSA
ncbi:helix-turn-helix domain-containing protein [Rhodococcus gannanensis]|uniref:Helix-turn-helix domain-containing protein n=1 Tax=Rhodococcus gannanensis TaxID=1960308 RepID=A0ABW4P0C1_9NOCA